MDVGAEEQDERTAISLRLHLDGGNGAFEFIRELGRGAFGKANLVRSRHDAQLYVLKVLDLGALSEKERLTSIGEIEVLGLLRHPNIIAYYGCFFEHGSHLLNIVLEYADSGDLAGLIQGLRERGKVLREDKLLELVCQLASALECVHSMKILHRDLKSNNILLHRSTSGAMVVKLADFGVSRILNQSMASTVIGTPYYMSPELLNNARYNQKSDIWALGCCIYELATLQRVFEASNMCALVVMIMRGVYAPLPPRCSPELAALVGSMLQQDASKRPSISEVISAGIVQRSLAASATLAERRGTASLDAAHAALSTTGSATDSSAASSMATGSLSLSGGLSSTGGSDSSILWIIRDSAFDDDESAHMLGKAASGGPAGARGSGVDEDGAASSSLFNDTDSGASGLASLAQAVAAMAPQVSQTTVANDGAAGLPPGRNNESGPVTLGSSSRAQWEHAGQQLVGSSSATQPLPRAPVAPSRAISEQPRDEATRSVRSPPLGRALVLQHSIRSAIGEHRAIPEPDGTWLLDFAANLPSGTWSSSNLSASALMGTLSGRTVVGAQGRRERAVQGIRALGTMIGSEGLGNASPTTARQRYLAPPTTGAPVQEEQVEQLKGAPTSDYDAGSAPHPEATTRSMLGSAAAESSATGSAPPSRHSGLEIFIRRSGAGSRASASEHDGASPADLLAEGDSDGESRGSKNGVATPGDEAGPAYAGIPVAGGSPSATLDLAADRAVPRCDYFRKRQNSKAEFEPMALGLAEQMASATRATSSAVPRRSEGSAETLLSAVLDLQSVLFQGIHALEHSGEGGDGVPSSTDEDAVHESLVTTTTAAPPHPVGSSGGDSNSSTAKQPQGEACIGSWPIASSLDSRVADSRRRSVKIAATVADAVRTRLSRMQSLRQGISELTVDMVAPRGEVGSGAGVTTGGGIGEAGVLSPPAPDAWCTTTRRYLKHEYAVPMPEDSSTTQPQLGSYGASLLLHPGASTMFQARHHDSLGDGHGGAGAHLTSNMAASIATVSSPEAAMFVSPLPPPSGASYGSISPSHALVSPHEQTTTSSSPAPPAWHEARAQLRAAELSLHIARNLKELVTPSAESAEM